MTYTWTDNAMQGGTACDVDKANENLMYLKDALDNSSVVPRNYISGLLVSNNTTDSEYDVDISEGECANNDNSGCIKLTTSITKQIDANWGEGTNAGGFPSGLTLNADTWYHVFVISKPDGTVDAGFDTDLSASNLLSDASLYTKYRRVGSILTDSSSNIVLFNAKALAGGGMHVDFSSQITETSGTTIAAQAIAVRAPLGIKTKPLFTSYVKAGAAGNDQTPMYLGDPDVYTSTPPKVNNAIGGGDDSHTTINDVFTNTSSQVKILVTGANTPAFALLSKGYIDERIS